MKKLYPPLNEVEEGLTGFTLSICPSVHPSVCPSERLSICGKNRVHSVSPTILAGSIWNLHISIHQIQEVCGMTVFSCDLAALWMVFSVRLSVRPSVRPSVSLSHHFDHVPINVSSWNFQELSPRTRLRSMQKVKVKRQRLRSQRSQPNLIVSGL